MSFADLSIQTKVYVLTGIVTTALVICVVFSLYSMGKIGNELETIATEDIPLSNTVSRIAVHKLEQAIYFERAMRYGEFILSDTHSANLFKQSVKSFSDYQENITQEILNGEKLAQRGISIAHNEHELQVFRLVQDRLELIDTVYAKYLEHVSATINSFKQSNIKDVLLYAENATKEEIKLHAELMTLMEELEKFTAGAVVNAERHEKKTYTVLILVGVFSMLLSFLLSIIIIRAITIPVNKLKKSIEYISLHSDLTHRVNITSKDEIGTIACAFDRMLEHFQNIVQNVNSSVAQLSTAAEELSVITKESSDDIKIQTSQTEQVATAIHQMATMVQEVAHNAGGASLAVNETTVEANNGREVVSEAINSMNQLAAEFERAGTVVIKLEHDSEKIGAVLDVIRGIAEQTNLLALNAAIEAARAGEQGRGFAVVADEVRTLASRTQESTEEIQKMIESLQVGTKAAVNAMELSRTQADVGLKKISTAGATLTTIVSGIEHINEMNAHIASASEEQSAVTVEIDQNIAKITEISVHSVANADQTKTASEELSRLSIDLKGLVAQFHS